MNRTVAVGAASAAIAAVVVIAVYEGRVSAKPPGQPDQPARPIAAGEQVTLPAPTPVEPPPVVAVAKAAVDGARRQQIAAAIARVRAAPRVGGAPAAAAPDDPSPGVLDKDEIRAGVKDVVPMLSECFEAELERDPTIGRVDATAHLTIDSAADIGTVVAMGDLEVDGPLGQSQDFHDCMTATLEAMVLPPMGDGGHVEVTYPFVFAPTDEPEPAAPTAPPPPAASRKPTPARPPKPVPPSDPAELASSAAAAAMNGNYAHALAMAERGLTLSPNATVRNKLVNIAVLTACKLRNVKRARRYYALVTSAAKAKAMLAESCRRDLGVDLAAEEAAAAAATGPTPR